MAMSETDKTVYSWGYGKYGQLGHGDIHNTMLPKSIEALKGQNVSMIDCGHSHSGAIIEGEVYMWGCNTDSRLILENSNNVLVPSTTLMNELKREDPKSFYAIKLALGASHTAVITVSGELFTAGSNVDGQLGCQMNASMMSSSEQEDPDETLFSPLNQVLPYGDEGYPIAKEVFCGDSFTMVLDSKNKVQIYGKGTPDQLQQHNSKFAH